MNICICFVALPFLLINSFPLINGTGSPPTTEEKQIIDAANKLLNDGDPSNPSMNMEIERAKAHLSTTENPIKDALAKLEEAKTNALMNIKTEEEKALKEAKVGTDISVLEKKLEGINVKTEESDVNTALGTASQTARLMVEDALKTATNSLNNEVTSLLNGLTNPSDQIKSEINAEKDKQITGFNTIKESAILALDEIKVKVDEAVNLEIRKANDAISDGRKLALEKFGEKLKEINKPAGNEEPVVPNVAVQNTAENAENRLERAEEKAEDKITNAGKRGEKEVEEAQKKAEADIDETKDKALEMAKTNSEGAKDKMKAGEEQAKAELEMAITKAGKRIQDAKDEADKSVKKVEKEGEEKIDKTAKQQEQVKAPKAPTQKKKKSSKEETSPSAAVETTILDGKETLIEAESEAEKSLNKAFEDAKNSLAGVAKIAVDSLTIKAKKAMEEVSKAGSGGGGGGGSQNGGIASQTEVDNFENVNVKPERDPNCNDVDEDNCVGNMNLCKNRAYFHIMSKSCRMTCGHCIPESFQCRDRYKPDCDMWGPAFCASKVYTKGMKLQQCAQSCGLCS